MILRRRHLLGLMLAVLITPAIVHGDIYELKDGGEIAGDLQRNDGGDYLIKTTDGGLISVSRDQLQRIVPQNELSAEYAHLARTTPDTADGHRQLAQWCNQHGMLPEADRHLARVAELDPADDAARRSLGYLRVGNRWLTHDQVMTLRGMQLWEGKYRNRQDIAIRERDKQGDAAAVDWLSKIRVWRGWLDSRRPDRVEDAERQISAIDDPSATSALVKLLDDESDSSIFELFLDAIGRLDHPLAVQTLVAYSLEDEDPNIRDKCLDYLISGKRPVVILPYVQALRDKDNVIVNRAGAALGKIGDPAAISPLIDALVTRHKYPLNNAPPGKISAGFNPSGAGGGGLQMGGKGPQFIERDRQNLEVQRALIKLSGIHDYDFDEQAWRRWYVDRQMREHVNSRRDQ